MFLSDAFGPIVWHMQRLIDNIEFITHNSFAFKRAQQNGAVDTVRTENSKRGTVAVQLSTHRQLRAIVGALAHCVRHSGDSVRRLLSIQSQQIGIHSGQFGGKSGDQLEWSFDEFTQIDRR